MKSRVNLLSEEQFWSFIQYSVENSTNQEQQFDVLVKLLSKLSIDEIAGFDYQLCKLLAESCRSSLWAAVHMACWGCGDSTFAFFRTWLISRGKEVFENAIKEPDSLLEEFIKMEGKGGPFFDPFFSICGTAYKQKGGDWDDFASEIYWNYTDDLGPDSILEVDMEWEDEDDESIKRICPRIFKRYYEFRLI